MEFDGMEGETNEERLTIAPSVLVWLAELSDWAINLSLYFVMFK